MRLLPLALAASLLLVSLAPVAAALPQPECALPHQMGVVPWTLCTAGNGAELVLDLACFGWHLVWGPAEPCPSPWG